MGKTAVEVPGHKEPLPLRILVRETQGEVIQRVVQYGRMLRRLLRSAQAATGMPTVT